MAKKESDLNRLRNNKTGVRFTELIQILNHHGWSHQSTSGSHHVYCKTKCLPIMVVKPHGKQKYCHPMDVNKVISALEAEGNEIEKDDSGKSEKQ